LVTQVTLSAIVTPNGQGGLKDWSYITQRAHIFWISNYSLLVNVLAHKAFVHMYYRAGLLCKAPLGWYSIKGTYIFIWTLPFIGKILKTHHYIVLFSHLHVILSNTAQKPPSHHILQAKALGPISYHICITIS
jgi:hypothetical protein